jgi:DnaJ-domain-containing protein 1
MREDTHRLEEEKATLKEMVESHDELLMEMAREMGLDRMGEDDEEEEEDVNDGGDAIAPPAAVPGEINEEGPVEAIPEQEAPMSHEVILADVEPKMPQVRLYHALKRDYEEHLLRMEDDFDDLDNDSNEGRSDMDEWFPEDGSNDSD